MNKTNVRIIERLQNFLKNWEDKKSTYCESPKDFSRKRKLSFKRVVVFLINLPRKSLSIELGNFYEQLGSSALESCTKSAFSQARKKLKWEFFSLWNKEFVKSYYKEKVIKTWQGHTLIGIDGSTGSLFNDKKGEIATHFGNMSGSIMSRILNGIDVLNGITIKATIFPVRESEMGEAKKWVKCFKDEFPYLASPLLLLDRGFAGFAFAWLLQEAGLDFVVRYPVGFNGMVKDFIAGEEQDSIVEWKISRDALRELKASGYEVDNKVSLKVRLVKVLLDTGETEVLVSSLLGQNQYAHEDFKALYFLRWGTEIKYDYWKNKAQIELVSGHSVKAIMQDFHATIFTSNLNCLLIEGCENQVKLINETRKMDYAVNKNVSLGFLKGRIVKLFLLPQPEKIIEQLKLLFIKHLEPIRPGRKNKRNFKAHNINGKYMTLTNYRRAI